MTELRRQVERIVRPIRGSAHRKMRMREELLVHLTSIFDEELAERHNNENAALAAAAGRFGEPATLRAELQAMVPRIEQLMCTPWEPAKSRFGRRPGETMFDYMRRAWVWLSGVNVLAFGTLLLVLVLAHGRRPARAHEASLTGFALFVAAYVLLYPVAVFGPIVLAERVWQALQHVNDAVPGMRRAARFRVVGYLLATMALYSSIALVFLVLLTRAIKFPFVSDFWFWSIVLGTSLIGLPITLLLLRDLRRWELWDGLVLDEVAILPRSAGDEG